MSAIGYPGRDFRILIDGERIAAVRTKSVVHVATPIDTTEGEDDGHRHIAEEADSFAIEVSVSGVATAENYPILLDEWYGELFTDVTIEHADGSLETPTDGAFLRSLEYDGESGGFVAFSAVFLFSGLTVLTTAFLLQENLEKLLQENGAGILL